MSLLNEIVAAPPKTNGKALELVETPEAGLVAPGRLTTASLLVTMQQLGKALQNAGEAFGQIPDSNPDLLPSLLEQIIAQTKGAQTKAMRLLLANR